MNSYAFLFPTLKVSFSSQTTSLFVCWGKVFSAVNKNVGSKSQVTVTREKSVHALPYTSQRSHDILLATITTLSIYHLHLELCASNLLKQDLLLFPNHQKRFQSNQFYWCKLLSIQSILLEYLQMFFLFMSHLVSKNLFEQVFLENEK